MYIIIAMEGGPGNHCFESLRHDGVWELGFDGGAASERRDDSAAGLPTLDEAGAADAPGSATPEGAVGGVG